MSSASIMRQRQKWLIDAAIHEALSETGTPSSFVPLLNIVRSRSDLLRPGRARWQQVCSVLRALRAMALRQSRRPMPDWRPPQGATAAVQFDSLLRHRFAIEGARIPSCFWNVWFTAAAGLTMEQRWYLHLAGGNSPRGLNIFRGLSRTAIERLDRAPAHLTIPQAVTWASDPVEQSSGLPFGTSRRRAKRARAGAPPRVRTSLPQVAIRGLHLADEATSPWSRRTWRIRQLCTVEDLVEEGRTLNHCVASYAEWCRRGCSSIWSLQVCGTMSRQRLVTLEVHPGTREVVQARGLRNRPMRDEERGIVEHWAHEQGLTLIV